MKTSHLLIIFFLCSVFYFCCNSLMVLPSSSSFTFASILPRKVHITKSHSETSFSWSISSFADSCTLSLESSNLTVSHYSQHIYNTYFYHLAVPNKQAEQASSYMISCSTEKFTESRSFRLDSQESLQKVLFFGDFSTSKIGDKLNSQHASIFKANILKYLEADIDKVDSIWHLGDFAYDLYSNAGARGLEFLSDIEKIASFKPYVSVAGNHEIRNNFKDFKSFFNDDLFFSRTVGPCKIITICTEFDFFYMKPGLFPIRHSFLMYLKQKQLNWLAKELKSTNRKNFPFLVVVGHKPLYCSKNYDSKMIMSVCTLQAEVMRSTFEGILVKYKVDLGIFAHIHLYERTLPVKYGSVEMKVSPVKENYYLNPAAPIYVITGVAGNLESEDIIFNITSTPDPWTVTISESLGYGLLTVHNSSHLQFQQFSFGKTQWDEAFENFYNSKREEDSFWIIKQKG